MANPDILEVLLPAGLPAEILSSNMSVILVGDQRQHFVEQAHLSDGLQLA